MTRAITFVAAVAVYATSATTVAQGPALPIEQPPVGVAGEARPVNSLGYAVQTEQARAAGLAPAVLDLALSAVACGVSRGDLEAPPTLTVIDYSRPSTVPRLWVFDLQSGALLFSELVAHGQHTGENLAERFSDILESRQSSLGLFVTANTYVGRNGYSLRLDGLEPGFNARARERAIVMHGAPYVSTELAARQGRLGRSWGCPALRDAVARELIDTIRDGGVVFSYYPDRGWLDRSRFLNCPPSLEQAPQHPGGLLVHLHALGQ